MNNTLGMRTILALGLLALVLATAPARAQEYRVEPIADTVGTASTGEQGFTQAELDQMLAPIALYPDALLSQVLIASTYPLEIVEAARWSQRNAGLEGEAAVEAVADRGWDPSVKALVAFPDLLAQMNDDLEWTRRLGDAMLYQEPEVMDSIQFLRARADAAGSFESTEHVRVIREEKTIIIEPAETRVVYVPYYDPYIVYGTWWRPAYPPVYWARPAYYYRGYPGFYWGSGIHVSSGFFFSSFYWPQSSIVIVNTPRYYQPARYYGSKHYYKPGQRWKHNPVHRRGVAYRHPDVKKRYDSPRLKAGPVTRWPLSGRTASQAGRSTPDHRRPDSALTDRSRDRPVATSRAQGRVQAEERRSPRASGATHASAGTRATRPSASSTEARLRGTRETARRQPSAAARPQPAASRTQRPVSQRQQATSPPQRTASAATRSNPRAQAPGIQQQRQAASRAPRATSSGRSDRTAAAPPARQPRATSRGNGRPAESRASSGNAQREGRGTDAQNTRRSEPGQNGRRRD